MLNTDYSACPLTDLVAALVHVSGRVVVQPEHGHQAVAGAVGAADVAALGADTVHVQADTAHRL